MSIEDLESSSAVCELYDNLKKVQSNVIYSTDQICNMIDAIKIHPLYPQYASPEDKKYLDSFDAATEIYNKAISPPTVIVEPSNVIAEP